MQVKKTSLNTDQKKKEKEKKTPRIQGPDYEPEQDFSKGEAKAPS